MNAACEKYEMKVRTAICHSKVRRFGSRMDPQQQKRSLAVVHPLLRHLQMRWKASCGIYVPLTHFPPNLIVLSCSVTGSSCFTWCEWNLCPVTTRAAAAAYLLCYSTLYNWACWWGGLALSSASVKICHLSQLKDVLIAS